MKNINLLLKTIFAFTLLVFIGCEKEEYTLGAITAPSAISITAEIVGADADNPNGDGTGVVHFTATGNDVITWKFYSKWCRKNGAIWKKQLMLLVN